MARRKITRDSVCSDVGELYARVRALEASSALAGGRAIASLAHTGAQSVLATTTSDNPVAYSTALHNTREFLNFTLGSNEIGVTVEDSGFIGGTDDRLRLPAGTYVIFTSLLLFFTDETPQGFAVDSGGSVLTSGSPNSYRAAINDFKINYLGVGGINDNFGFAPSFALPRHPPDATEGLGLPLKDWTVAAVDGSAALGIEFECSQDNNLITLDPSPICDLAIYRLHATPTSITP